MTARKFPGETRYQVLYGDQNWRDEETKTQCPVCRGTGKEDLEALGPVDKRGNSKTSMYRFRVCNGCRGAGMVTASQAKKLSGVRKKAT